MALDKKRLLNLPKELDNKLINLARSNEMYESVNHIIRISIIHFLRNKNDLSDELLTITKSSVDHEKEKEKIEETKNRLIAKTQEKKVIKVVELVKKEKSLKETIVDDKKKADLMIWIEEQKKEKEKIK
jgi:hypothetical protein